MHPGVHITQGNITQIIHDVVLCKILLVFCFWYVGGMHRKQGIMTCIFVWDVHWIHSFIENWRHCRKAVAKSCSALSPHNSSIGTCILRAVHGVGFLITLTRSRSVWLPQDLRNGGQNKRRISTVTAAEATMTLLTVLCLQILYFEIWSSYYHKPSLWWGSRASKLSIYTHTAARWRQLDANLYLNSCFKCLDPQIYVTLLFSALFLMIVDNDDDE